MSRTNRERPNGTESVVSEYVFDVRIVEVTGDSGETRYRFEAPQHCGREFESRELAELYADVYFDVNGFEEAGTGERGIPPEVVQAGRDTLAAYFLTQPYSDAQWVASFYGRRPEKVERYAERVRTRADEIREQVRERGLD
ncbi:hypothetical protein [Haloarchaeobius iranensis]|uniref:Uncharacterized protein n=1 Tax=Haloarchaeobius iranensis TaxID=996166 RepID=A0A1G9V1R3_9EURY|nr:hypothetical protein [Haloarchaeobius iranensis]SDM66069.1 hypothetical protein SAMN05192554_105139 [Haloarchaeobius iranensis]